MDLLPKRNALEVDFSDDDALFDAALKTIKQAVEPVSERRAAVMHKAMVISHH